MSYLECKLLLLLTGSFSLQTLLFKDLQGFLSCSLPFTQMEVVLTYKACKLHNL